jgi:hypothetical protein
MKRSVPKNQSHERTEIYNTFTDVVVRLGVIPWKTPLLLHCISEDSCQQLRT